MPEERTRTSKWDDPLDHEFPRSSLEAAAEAAAKVNAVLIAKGKLKPSQLSNQAVKQKAAPAPNVLLVAEVDINDVPAACRNLLTRGSTQDEISKMCSAAVSTRGRYISPDEPRRYSGDQRPLYLCIQGPTQASIDKAVAKVHEIINNSYKSKMPRFSGPPPGWPAKVPPPLQTNQPPPLMSFSAVPTELLQDKIYIGLDHAPPAFDVKNKILGVGGSYLQHVETETMARVTLRGKGSDFIEPATGTEAFEPMHIHIQHPTLAGLQQAKQLAENLVQTVQQEFAQFQLAFTTMPPPSVAPPPQLPGTASLFAIPPPPQHQSAPPGGSISLLAPPQAPQTTTYITSMTSPQQGLTVLGQQSQPSLPSPGGVGMPAAIVSNPTVLVNTSVPPPNFLPQATSIQSHIIQLGNNPSQGQPPDGLGLPQPQVLLQPTVSLQPATQHITLQPGAPHTPQPGAILQQQPPQQHIMVSLSQPGTPPVSQQTVSLLPGGLVPPWPPGQPPQQALTTTSLMPQGWVQAPPPGQVLQVVHQLAPPGVGSPAQGPPPALPPPPQQQPQQQQQYWPMVINHQGLPPSVQLTPGGQIVAPPPMSQPMPQPSPPSQQPPQVVGQTPYSMGQIYNIHYVSASTTTSSVSPSVTTTPTSGSQTPSHSAPTQPVKRRFTEEKPPMTDNENLLGYQHGPPHLMNMVSSAPTASSPSTAVPQQSVQQHPPHTHPSQPLPPPSGAPSTQVSSAGPLLNFDAMAPPPPPPTTEENRLHIKQEVGRDDCKGGVMAMPMPPLPPPLSGGVQQQVTDLDKKLMPPPPPPPTSHDRGQPERKKAKGALGSVAAYGGEEDDDDTKTCLPHQPESASYCFNQYSSKPQLYVEQPGLVSETPMQYSVSGLVAPPQSFDQQGAPQVMSQHPSNAVTVSQVAPVQNGGRPTMMVYQDANGVTHQYQSDYGQPVSLHQGYDAPSYPRPPAGQPVMSSQSPECAQPPPAVYSLAPGVSVTATPPPPPPGPPPQQPQQVNQYVGVWGMQQQQQQQSQQPLSPQPPNWDGVQKRAQFAPQQQPLMQNIGQFTQPPPPPPPPTSQYYQVPPYMPQY